MNLIEGINIIKSQLQVWPGYSTFQEVMNDHPDGTFFIAGGALRNIFLGSRHRPKDFDLFIGGPECQDVINQLAESGHMVDGPFGSPRWFPEDNNNGYADIIPISKFYNGLWHCRDITDVLNQFDFTCNAIAVDLQSDTFYDPQNGMRDLDRRLMRMVRFDYPDEPILKGHPLSRTSVLWFRILHYAAKLDLIIEPVTLKWLCSNVDCQEYLDDFRRYFFNPEISYLEPLQKIGAI